MLTPKTTSGYPPLYSLSMLFFIVALAGIGILIVTDVLHRFRGSLLHQHLDALPLIMIGLSYITLQLATKGNRIDQIKGILLGIAFLLWGGEQLLPPSKLVTFMDEGAVTIFVVDVSFNIWGRIALSDQARMP